MSTGETIGIIIFAIVAIGFRFLWHYFLFFKKSDFTTCPNCKKEKPRVKKGKYKCDSCGFVFEVDKQGDAIKYSLWPNIFIIGLGIFLIILFFNFLFHKKSPTEELLSELSPHSTFDSIYYPIIFSVLIILLLYFGIKGIIGYRNDRKTAHNKK